MTMRPSTNNDNNGSSAFDRTSRLPTSTMTASNDANDVLQKLKEQIDAGSFGDMEARMREIYNSMSDTWQLDRRGTCDFCMLAAVAAKRPALVPDAGEELQRTQENGDAGQEPPSVPDTGAKVKKAPHHSQHGGLNGCNLFKQHKKYCIVIREITLNDFVENFFAHAREIRCRSVCKSDVALPQGLARAGPRGINARLLDMWRKLSPEQRHEYNARASDIKTRTAIILRDKHKVRQKG
jgi:hypothetical protein